MLTQFKYANVMEITDTFLKKEAAYMKNNN